MQNGAEEMSECSICGLGPCICRHEAELPAKQGEACMICHGSGVAWNPSTQKRCPVYLLS